MIPHHYESLSPVIYLVQMQVPQIPNSTRRRQPFLTDHLLLAVFSTPLDFKICPSPQSRYGVLSDLPYHTPSLEYLDSKRGYCYDFSYFVLFTYVFSLFLEVSHGAATLTHFSLTHLTATLLTHSTAIVLTHSIAILIALPHWYSIYSGQFCRLFSS